MNRFVKWSTRTLPWLFAVVLPLANVTAASAADVSVGSSSAASPDLVVGSTGSVIHIKGGNFGTSTPTVKFKTGSTTNFSTSTACSLTLTSGCIASHTNTAISVKAPSSSLAGVSGDQDISVTTGGGSPTTATDLTSHPANQNTNGIEFSYSPAITKISPQAGPAGTVVHLTGGNLAPDTTLPSVQFGTNSLSNPAINTMCAPLAHPPVTTNCIVSHSAKAIAVKAPTSLTSGEQFVTVTVGSGATQAEDMTATGMVFDYSAAVTKMSSTPGTTGALVHITGGNFGTGTPTVTFTSGSLTGSTTGVCTSTSQTGCVVSHSTKSIVVKAPSGNSGLLSGTDALATVSVTPGGATSAADDLTQPPARQSTGQLFDYGPGITKISPQVGVANQTLHITGGNFAQTAGAVVAVQFGSNTPISTNTMCAPLAHPAVNTDCVVSITNKSIAVKVPSTLTSSSGPQYVKVIVCPQGTTSCTTSTSGQRTADDLTPYGANQSNLTGHRGAWFVPGAPAITKVS